MFDFSRCSSLLFASAVGDRDKAGILLFSRDGSSLSPGDIIVVVDLPVAVVTPLFPLSFLFPPCSLEVSVAGRGLLGEVRLRLRLKLGSAPQLALDSVLPRESASPSSSGLRPSDWATPFLRLKTSGRVSMVMGSD